MVRYRIGIVRASADYSDGMLLGLNDGRLPDQAVTGHRDPQPATFAGGLETVGGAAGLQHAA
jgi:hypothetical protein